VRTLKRFFVVVWVGATALLTGCQSKLSNTEGHAFDVRCEGTRCSLARDGNPSGYRVESGGRILTACPAGGSDFDCRPLRCEDSGACSKLGGAGFSCVHALCQAPAQELTSADRTALCLAGTGPFERTPLQLERVTTARACRGDCTVPAGCLRY
jgi:hypothetical protein